MLNLNISDRVFVPVCPCGEIDNTELPSFDIMTEALDKHKLVCFLSKEDREYLSSIMWEDGMKYRDERERIMKKYSKTSQEKSAETNKEISIQGWQCPTCKRVYSPSTPMCYQCPTKYKTTHSNTPIPPFNHYYPPSQTSNPIKVEDLFQDSILRKLNLK